MSFAVSRYYFRATDANGQTVRGSEKHLNRASMMAFLEAKGYKNIEVWK